MAKSPADLFTIGYSSFHFEDFLRILTEYDVKLLVDVRSQPHSSQFPQFNKEPLENALKSTRRIYRNYAKEFGARQTERCYYTQEGYLDFERYVQSPAFIDGLRKLKKALADGYTFALMCAEKDPSTCHRSIMVSREFEKLGYNVAHILPDGKLESQTELENRLLDAYFADRIQMTLSGDTSDDELIPLAYKKRNAEIAFKIQEL